MQDNELLLIDAGCAMVITTPIPRTFPVGGRVTPEQRLCMRLFVSSKQRTIAQVQPGNPYNSIHDTAVRVTEGLVELGILKVKLTS